MNKRRKIKNHLRCVLSDLGYLGAVISCGWLFKFIVQMLCRNDIKRSGAAILYALKVYNDPPIDLDYYEEEALKYILQEIVDSNK